MNKVSRIGLLATTFAVVIALGGGTPAMASGGGTSPQGSATTGSWPAGYPLPTSPGTVKSQSTTRAVVRSTDTVAAVTSKLDTLYVTQKGCINRPAVNKPKNYFCTNPATKKTDEIYFTFAALDPTAVDPSRSQSNAFLVRG